MDRFILDYLAEVIGECDDEQVIALAKSGYTKDQEPTVHNFFNGPGWKKFYEDVRDEVEAKFDPQEYLEKLRSKKK
jgi:hypothetical protein